MTTFECEEIDGANFLKGTATHRIYKKAGPAARTMMRHERESISSSAGMMRDGFAQNVSQTATIGWLTIKRRSRDAIREAVLDAKNDGIHLSAEVLAESIRVSFDRLSFLGESEGDVVRHFGETLNSMAHSHRKKCKKVQKSIQSLERSFQEMYFEDRFPERIESLLSELREHIQTELDLPITAKKFIQPAAFFTECIWPILLDSGVSTRPGSKMIADALIDLGEVNKKDRAKVSESIRQKIVSINHLVR